MPNVDLSFASDPNTLALAIIYGMAPAIAWLVFWLRENKEPRRKNSVLTSLFFGGAIMVVFALPVERAFLYVTNSDTLLTIFWAASEELLKFGLFAFIVLRSATLDVEPIDFPIYVMIAALGFAGFENALYFLQPLQTDNSVVLILSGTMRFLGTTLMHATTSSFAGIALGLSYFKSKKVKIWSCVVGLAAAVAFHSIFNLLIVTNSGTNFLQIFGSLWVFTIILLVLFEKLRRMGSKEYRKKIKESVFARAEELFSLTLSATHMVKTDTTPFEAGLKSKGSSAKQFELLNELIGILRGMYGDYLGSQGADLNKVTAVVLSAIPDSLSPKIANDIIEILRVGYITVITEKLPETKFTIASPRI